MSTHSPRAQAGLEHMALTAIAMVLIVVGFAYAYNFYDQLMTDYLMTSAIKKISNGVNRAYLLGEGTSMLVEIDLPTGVTQGVAIGRAIDYTILTQNGSAFYSIETDANMGDTNLPAKQGRNVLKLVVAGGKVIITEAVQ